MNASATINADALGSLFTPWRKNGDSILISHLSLSKHEAGSDRVNLMKIGHLRLKMALFRA